MLKMNRMIFAFCLVLSAAVIVSAEEKSSPDSAGEKIAIIYTNSTNGNLQACHCPKHPTGGLVRRATIIRETREKYPTLVLDSGDLFPVEPDRLKIEFALKLMEYLRCDAVGIGDQEFAMGVDYFQKVLKKGAIPFISSDIYLKDSEGRRVLLAQGSVVKKIGNTKIAVISIIIPHSFTFYPPENIEGLEIVDPVPQLKEDIARLKKEADLIVVISHSGYDYDIELPGKVSGIDLIVGGHSQTLMEKPEKKGNTVIVQAGAKGDNVGRLVLEIDKDKKIKSFENELVLLDEKIADDPDAQKIAAEYDEAVNESNKKIIIK